MKTNVIADVVTFQTLSSSLKQVLLRLSSKRKITMSAKTATHPKYIDMIVSAIKALGDKSGSSRQAINKYIVQEYKLTENNHHSAMLKQALKRGSGPNGPLVHNKGKGAAGSFKVKPAPAKPAKTVAKKAPAKKSASKKGPAKKKAPAAKGKAKPAKRTAPPKETTALVEAPAAKKTAKPSKAKVTRKSGKKSKAASPKKPKVMKAKKSAKKAASKK